MSASIFKNIKFYNDVRISEHEIREINRTIDRTSAYNLLSRILNYNIEKAILVESGIFEFSIIYTRSNNIPELIDSVYNDKLQDILENLDELRNSYLKPKILDGSINAQQVPLMHHSLMDPDKWKTIMDKIYLKEYKKNNPATSTLYTCRKCKSKKCRTAELQTRSGDEGATIFIECMCCNFTWTR